jgi:hypothetical protein
MNSGFIQHLNFHFMSKQKTHMTATGRLGDVIYKKTKDGFVAVPNITLDRKRILSDPKFQRTRENGAEFGRAGIGGRLVRESFHELLKVGKDSRLTVRLTKVMHQVVKSDPSSDRGFRNITSGDLTLLRGFEFNSATNLRQTLGAQFTATIDRVTGAATVVVASFIPANLLSAPPGATHYQLHSGAAAINFDTEVFKSALDTSNDLPIDNAAAPALTLVCNVPANSPDPIVQTLGISFSQEVNGKKYPLSSGAFNAFSVVEVSQD